MVPIKPNVDKAMRTQAHLFSLSFSNYLLQTLKSKLEINIQIVSDSLIQEF